MTQQTIPCVTIECPFCGAEPGYACFSTGDRTRIYPHSQREKAYRRMTRTKEQPVSASKEEE